MNEHKKEPAKLEEDVEKACGMYNEARDLAKEGDEDAQKLAEERTEDVIQLIGSLSRGTHDAQRIICVLHALGDLGDPRGARYVRSHLKQRDREEADDVLQTAVATAGEVVDPSLVEPLLKIVEDSKTYGIMKDAVDALGAYGSVGHKRAKILETLVDTSNKVKPGARPRMQGSQEKLSGDGGVYGRESASSQRWSSLSTCVPRALCRLTGRSEASLTEWIWLVRNYKGKLDELFVDSED